LTISVIVSFSMFLKFYSYVSLSTRTLRSFPTRRSSDLGAFLGNNLSVERLVPDGLDSVARENLSSVRFIRADEGLVPTMKLQLVDRKSTRLNSSHVKISYAVFCLKKKKKH